MRATTRPPTIRDTTIVELGLNGSLMEGGGGGCEIREIGYWLREEEGVRGNHVSRTISATATRKP